MASTTYGSKASKFLAEMSEEVSLSFVVLSPELYYYLRVTHREIRVLRLSPSNNPEVPVHCSVEHISLDDPGRPAYHALSYVWGNSSTTRTIEVDNAHIPVPVNLAVALQHVRVEDEATLL